MDYQIQLAAIERSITGIVTQFMATPDAFFSGCDARAALYGLLRQHEILATCYVTRDGHHTNLVHCAYPATCEPAETGRPPVCHDLVVLSAGYLRGHYLDVVARRTPAPKRALHAHCNAPGTKPLLAIINLALLDRYTVDPLATVAERYALLERGASQSYLRYLMVLYRHWEQSKIAGLAKLLAETEKTDPECRSVLVQSFRDDMGQVTAGRYGGEWTHLAQLTPLDSQPSPWRRHGWRPT